MNVGMNEIWSKFFANTALTKPAEREHDERQQHRGDHDEQVLDVQGVKNSATIVTTTPTSKPRSTPPDDVAEHDQPVRQRRDQQLLDVRPNFAPKNDDTTLP